MKRALTTTLAIFILIAPLVSLAGDCGDVDGTATVDLLDITYIINYLYKAGPAPLCETAYGGDFCGDVNNNGSLDLLDITYIINYLYKGGPIPQCGCGILADIDGNEYTTIVIGDQCWMMENMEVTHYRNGDPIPHVTDSATWNGLSSGAYCEYDNNPSHVPTYGRLYNWYAVDDSRNIAPDGWHVPTDEEWKQLEMYLGMSQAQADSTGLRGTDEGGKLKDTGTTHWHSPNDCATNESGFTALAGGYRSNSHEFIGMGDVTHFWSSSTWEDSSGFAWHRHLYSLSCLVRRSPFYEQGGISVRCVRDSRLK